MANQEILKTVADMLSGCQTYEDVINSLVNYFRKDIEKEYPSLNYQVKESFLVFAKTYFCQLYKKQGIDNLKEPVSSSPLQNQALMEEASRLFSSSLKLTIKALTKN